MNKAQRRSREVLGNPVSGSSTIRDSWDLERRFPKEAALVRERLAKIITPEFKFALMNIFLSIVGRSGIAREHSNVNALGDEPLLGYHTIYKAWFSPADNRIRNNISSGVKQPKVLQAVERRAKRLCLEENPERRVMVNLIDDLDTDIHEKVHQMGRVFLDNRWDDEIPRTFFDIFKVWKKPPPRLWLEMGLFRQEKMLWRSIKNEWISEGLTTLISFLILDELNDRLNLGLDLDFYMHEFFPAPETIEFSYSGCTFVVLTVIQKVARGTRLPARTIAHAFVQAYFFGDEYYMKETKALIDTVMGAGFYEDLSSIRVLPEPEDELDRREAFIHRWKLGDVTTGFGSLIDALRAEKIFSSYVRKFS